MTLNLVLFLGLALVAIVSAIGLLASQHPVYSALYLILNFATVAVFYLLLAAPFLALIQVAVYAGAIMVLFLFVIMLMGSDVLTGRSTVLPWQRPVAFVLGAILVVETVYLLFFRAGDSPQASNLQPSFGGPLIVGQILYNQYTLPFEVTSILLLVAMIGVIILTRSSKRKIEN
ncbi:MAG TPA: NADH-quinone oxidoreductase subunit J [Anaerolineales bacterium]